MFRVILNNYPVCRASFNLPSLRSIAVFVRYTNKPRQVRAVKLPWEDWGGCNSFYFSHDFVTLSHAFTASHAFVASRSFMAFLLSSMSDKIVICFIDEGVVVLSIFRTKWTVHNINRYLDLPFYWYIFIYYPFTHINDQSRHHFLPPFMHLSL